MVKSLLERFGISVPKDFHDYNLIGVDFGDGEISAACVVGQSGKFVVKDLLFDSGAMLIKNPNAYWISNTSREMVRDPKSSQLDRESEGIRYYNFKKCPGTPESRMKYVKDDGMQDTRTYEEVMGIGFDIAVNLLFKHNNLLDKWKPTIILVGCPSSKGWQIKEQEYAELLRRHLHVEGAQPIQVAVQAESWAALARETDPRWGKDRISRNQVIVIIDNGSSTFDMTVISRTGLAQDGSGEDSFQFGGNLIDENLLRLLQKKLKQDCPGRQLKTLHGHKLGLRMAKENYYGVDGEARNTQIYTVTLNGEKDARGRLPKYEFRVDDDTMDEAISQMPVRAFHIDQGIGSMVKKTVISCDSFLDGCRKVYTSFYEKMQPLLVTRGNDREHPKVPDRVILSGGVSVMPEIHQIIEEVFGVKPEITDLPNYSVSQGLAYVLGCEIMKKNLLDQLCDTLDTTVPDGESLRQSIIAAGVEEDWQCFEQSMGEWAEKPKALSIEDWHRDYYLKAFNKDLTVSMREGSRQWYEKRVRNLISQKLNSSFRELFGDYADVFSYELPYLSFDNLGELRVTISCDYVFFFGQMMLKKEAFDTMVTDLRSHDWKMKAHQMFTEMEEKVKNGGTVTLKYSYMKEHLLRAPTNAVGTTDYSYDGIRKAYEKGFSLEAASKVRQVIIGILKDYIKEYVEKITPYFNMTARNNSEMVDVQTQKKG